MMKTPKHNPQAGNAVIFVLLGVILFGALIYTFTRSGQKGISNLNKQEAKIAAQDVMSYAQAIERAVNRVRKNGCSENLINFDDAALTAYTNGDAPGDNSCDIFNASGGNITYSAPPTKAGTATEWIFTGATEIEGAGEEGTGDLVIMLRGIDVAVCNEINQNLGITTTDNAPPGDATTPPYTKFVGTFANNAAINDTDADIDKKTAGCVELTGASEYVFFSTLLER